MRNFSREFLKVNQCYKDKHLLVAVSGGVDSVVLVHLLAIHNFKFEIAHCNFKLRGEASEMDAQFVKELAESLNVPFFQKDFDTLNQVESTGESVQMVARELRYDWFRELIDQGGHDFLVTAHHLNDSLETAIFNLVKGTGIAGVRGINPVNQNVLRPLIGFDKNTILNFATSKKLEWREDESNISEKYHRNFIRHKIIPQLEVINPSVVDSFSNTSQRLLAVEAVYEAYLDQLRKDVIVEHTDHYTIDISWIIDDWQKTIVFDLVKKFGFSFKQAQEIFEGENSGASFYSQTNWLVRDRNQLVITPIESPEVSIEIGQNKEIIRNGIYSYHMLQKQYEEEAISRHAWEASFDASLLKFPLQVRNWQTGDRFQPLGMMGKKKVSDFMIDNKIPVNLKKRIQVVTSGNKIIWVIGYRIDDRFKVTDRTKQVFQIKVKRHNA